MPPFRLGLVGAGRMGRTHLRALAGSERVAVTAIAEMSPAAREAVAATGAAVYESVAEMLDRAAPDGVLIAAPTDQHGAIIAEVAAAGGRTIAQDEASSTIYGMPRAAAELGARMILPLDAIGPELAALSRRVRS